MVPRDAASQGGAGSRIICCLAASISGLALVLGGAARGEGRWVFLASIVAFGLAHGACDPLVPGWVLERRVPGQFTAIFCLGYAALVGLVLLFWCWQPTGALLGFLLLTAWHWGSADAVLAQANGSGLLLLAWGRGIMVLAAPTAFHPHRTLQVLESLAPALSPILPVARLQIVAAVILVASVATQLSGWRVCTDRRRAGIHQLETLFLIGLFAACDPLLGTALYFIWFHAWRHILRLCRWQSPGPSSLFVQLGRFHLSALPCALGALALLWLVAWKWPGDLLRAYLILLSAVTLPHALLVGWLDRAETWQEFPAYALRLRTTTAVQWLRLVP